MKDNYSIRDNATEIFSGSHKEMQLIWDCLTRTLDDLCIEYRREFSRDELNTLILEYSSLEWEGNIELTETYAVFNKEEGLTIKTEREPKIITADMEEYHHLIPVHINKVRYGNYYYESSPEHTHYIRSCKIPEPIKRLQGITPQFKVYE